MTTRECKACDGIGSIDLRTDDQSEQVWCAACDRSGSITERIPASDAIADAETLRSFVRRTSLSAYYIDAEVYSVNANLDDALETNPIYAAQGAFRAVPGLRG